jgi:outer membrane protein OmpA-like peptidoglycan-associated protein
MKALWTLLLATGFLSIQGCCALGLIRGGPTESAKDRQAAELSKIAQTVRTDNGILVRLEGDIFFATGKTDLTQAAKKQIRAIAKILKKYEGNRIAVVGHTDDVGSFGDNQVLSEGRAKAVQDELVDDGVGRNEVSVAGMGERKPVAANDSDANRALNRRVELEIQPVD